MVESNFKIRVKVNGEEGWMDADIFFYYFKYNRDFHDNIPYFVKDEPDATQEVRER